MRINLAAAGFLLVVLPLAHGQSASKHFTISPETTVVDGPLNADGTINYVAAINAILSKGITNENNAAIPFLLAIASVKNQESVAPCLKELRVEFPADAVGLLTLEDYVASLQGKAVTPEVSNALKADLQKCMAGPWKAADFPQVTGWLKQEAGLALLEKACQLPRCYLPWVSKTTPPNWLDAMPSSGPFRSAAQMLAARAMLRAGNGDTTGALQDLWRVQTLARHVGEQRTDVALLVAVAMDYIAMRGYDALAANGGLTGEQLKMLRRQVETSPEIPSLGAASEIEEMLALDEAMACIRGDGQRILNVQAGNFSADEKYDLGDLPRTSWDVLLKAIRRETASNRDEEALPFEQQMKRLDEATTRALAGDIPGSILSSPDRKIGKVVLEAYLKLRAGETAEQYAARIAQWWVSGDPGVAKNVVKLIEKARLEREIAPVAISLAEYHIAHGAYPDSLTALGMPVPHDPFSGKEIIYRREKEGYILYSVGLNQKDDGGADDDRPVRADK